jgi:hypothetical protein
MFGFKKRAVVNPSVDDIVAKRIREFQLRSRVKAALDPRPSFERILAEFISKNSKKDIALVTRIAGHRSYLVERCGVSGEAAAKECLQMFVWNQWES